MNKNLVYIRVFCDTQEDETKHFLSQKNSSSLVHYVTYLRLSQYKI